MFNIKNNTMNVTLKRVYRALLVFSFLFLIIPTITVSAADFSANPLVKNGYTLDFNDEFNGTTLDYSKWIDYYLPNWAANTQAAKGQYTFRNGCLVQYITSDQNAWCPAYDGTVKSSAIQSFDKSWIHNFSGTSGNIPRTTWYGYKTTYGYFEMRAKLADCGGGGHQAWWLVGMQQDTNDWFNSKQTAEIDIIETFFISPKIWQIVTIAWNDPNFSYNISTSAVPSGNPAQEFHIYAMDWTANSLKFYYDNQLYRQINVAPTYDMGMIINIYTDAGSGVHNNVWPKEWAIDYVRVWKKDNTSEPPPKLFTLKNRQTGKLAYIDPVNNSVKYGDITSNISNYAKWSKEQSGTYTLFKNYATGEYLHIEDLTGKLQHAIVPGTYYSAQWSLADVNGYTTLVNRWKPDFKINTQNNLGYLEYAKLPDSTLSCQWSIDQIMTDYVPYRLKNRQTGQYAYIDPANSFVKYGDITTANSDKANWYLLNNQSYITLIHAETNKFMHIECLLNKLQYGIVPGTYYSAQWQMNYIEGYVRFVNRWQSNMVINTENYLGVLEYSNRPLTYWTSQWMLEAV